MEIPELNYHIEDKKLVRKDTGTKVAVSVNDELLYRITCQLDKLLDSYEGVKLTTEEVVISEAKVESVKTALPPAEPKLPGDDDSEDLEPISINKVEKSNLEEFEIAPDKIEAIMSSIPFRTNSAFTRKFKSLGLEGFLSFFFWEEADK